VYLRPHDSRALARELAALRKASEERFRRNTGDVPDPTPPPDDVVPMSLTAWLLEHENLEST
jgi:hypothetical protein